MVLLSTVRSTSTLPERETELESFVPQDERSSNAANRNIKILFMFITSLFDFRCYSSTRQKAVNPVMPDPATAIENTEPNRRPWKLHPQLAAPTSNRAEESVHP